MFVVAVVELCGSLDHEAAALAADLGRTVYETRLDLSGGTPAIVLRTAAEHEAHALRAKIASRGSRAVACSAADVVSSADMTEVRSFRLDAQAVVLDDGTELPYGSVGCVFRAVHMSTSETVKESKSRQFSAGRAILSGGILMTKSASVATKTAAHEREQVLYCFRNDGEPPWIFRESRVNYAGLGPRMGVSRFENFKILLEVLRSKMPSAVYDERLVSVKRVPERLSTTGTAASGRTNVAASAGGIDLLAHLLSLAVGGRSTEYR